MVVNPIIKEVCKQHSIDVRKSILFCFAVSQPHEDLLSLLIDMDILDNENEPVFRLHFCNTDEEGELVLRFPFYVQDTATLSFVSFVREYLIKYGIGSNGHKDNPMPYRILDDATDNYNKLISYLPNVDYDRLAKVIANYYKTTEKCSAISKFLGPSALAEYENFEESESRLI